MNKNAHNQHITKHHEKRRVIPIETLAMKRKDYDPAAEVVKVLTAMREAISGLK